MKEESWNGFILPMGFFVVVKEGKVRVGKADPATKDVLEWYEHK